jgi:hypothetical protein
MGGQGNVAFNFVVKLSVELGYIECLKIRDEFRIQSVVGKDLVELEKFALPEEDISTLILFNT